MKQKTLGPFPAWADAQLGLKYIRKGKARGSRVGLWVRGESQKKLGYVGKCAMRRVGLLIFVGIVCLSLLCIGFQSIRLDTTLATLWTPDSGRLYTELNYVSKVSGLTTDTNEMLIQTPKADSHHSILNAKALLEHLEVLRKALSVTVDLYDVTWNMKDLCYSANIPTFDTQFIDQIFERVFPCVIVTPLDCLWEGSKLLGPDVPIKIPGFEGGLKWTNLNPQELLMRARLAGQAGEAHIAMFEILEGFMKRAGIGTGYQEKPCLNPKDDDCPITAPNKGSDTPPDVASVMSRGCSGFAPRFMHWAPDLIIGGPVHNKSGQLARAGGLMSTVQLMSSSELYDFNKETWRLNHVEWTEGKAQAVLTAWQARFTEEVRYLTEDEDRNTHFNFYSFTASGLDSVLESASQFSYTSAGLRVAGVMFLAVIVGVVFDGGNAPISCKVRVGLIFGGTAVALLGTAAGCGVAGFLKIPFNVASVQVLPYLAMSLISQVLYVLLHSQLNTGTDAKTSLKKYGFSILLGILMASVLVVAGALFPIPAVRSLALQGAIFLAVGSLALLVVYSAFCQLVLKKTKMSGSSHSKGVNVINTGNKNQPVSGSLKPTPLSSFKNNNITLNNEKNGQDKQYYNLLNNERATNGSKTEDIDVEIANDCEDSSEKCQAKSWPTMYIQLMNWKWFSGITVVLYLACIVVSAFGLTRLRIGLPITDVVPSHSSDWEFLTAQGKLFPVYHIRAGTKSNFDYPNNQKLLHKFHETMSGLPWVIRDDNGGVTPMWLTVFKTWLERLQRVFDEEWKLGYLHKEGWNDLASADGILAWKLAVQTGHVDHPVDITQIPSNRLVADGIINSRAFYVYLTAWAWNDPLAYGSTASNLKPEPRNWVHSPEDKDLRIPKSAPIKYAEISYLLRTSKEDGSQEGDQESQILDFVKEIRAICEKFEARGLPVFPWGIPFRFYDQYLTLPYYSAFVISLAVGSVFAILFFSLGLSLRPVGVVVVVAVVTSMQIAGAIGWLGVGLNALPVEIALLGVSLVVFPTVQIVVAFCCIPGSISDRRSVSFSLVGPPCVQSLILISLTALILYSPEFTFIFTHFTLLIALSSVFALLNVLLLVPVLLALIKPQSWLVGNMPEDPTYLQPLTPSPIPKRGGSSRSGGRCSSSNRTGGKSSSRGNYPPAPYSFRGSNSRNSFHGSNRGGHNRAPSEHSLSTITEEPTSCAIRRSAEIVVQPQVVVETFDRDSNSTTTKVSAKLKVEVHSSVHSSGGNSNPQSSVNTSTNMSENSGTSTSTSSSGSFTSSSASSTSSYNERMSMDE